MNRQERIESIFGFNEAEQIYRELYYNNPSIYFTEKSGLVYRNWSEFKEVYKQTVKKNIQVPDEPPTHMGEVLLESTFFLEEDRDVSFLMNAKYCPPFWHHLNFIKIMYVLNGRFILNTGNGKIIELKSGNFVVVPPDIEQSVFSYHDDDIVLNIFIRASTFEKAFSSLLMESKELAGFFWKVLYGKDDSSIIWFQCDSDETLDKFILDMFEEVNHSNSGGNFLLVSYVMVFLAYALYRYQNEMTSIRDTELRKDKLPAIIQFIRDNYNLVTLSSLADHFHKSEGYLSRYIKQETGYTLSHLLKEYRIKKAAIMLRNSDYSVEKIMLEVGYADISYFYKVFKLYYGMTPGQYRSKDRIIKL